MISVIVLSKNNGKTLENCLQSIINSYGDKEIIVVDAHSTDETPQILERYKEQVKIIYDEGKGIGIARNIGVEASGGEIICFVDADAFVSIDHFTRIERYLNENPEVGVIHVQGKWKLSERPTYIEKLGYICQSARLKHVAGIHGYAGGYFLSVRRKAFYDAGGFWDFPPFGADDKDFAVKVMDKGWKKGQIRTEGWHQFRRTIHGLLREMWGFGKGRSCFDKKYSNHPYVTGLSRQRKLYRIFGKKYLLGIELVRLLAPVSGLRYLPRWRRLDVYFYYIVREWVDVFAYMWGWLTWAKNV